ncbi:MAG TPA: FMN-dependent NADH-azoreductase [Burkholderiales bacterium]|jgi:FMN-dependent NADH-azoreductase|nr:FMN-dependent NADH-azoreductase [Burkholderiales bacterium]
MKVLQIKSSVFSGNGQSSRLADEFVALLRQQNPGARVVERDLAVEPVPHLDGARVAAFLAKPQERSTEQNAVLAYSDALIDELRRADVIVLGLPMYNFGVPSQLKAWFDHIARAGETFKYTDKGAVGLLTGKRAYVFAARGGVYAGTPNDWQTQYVRYFLEFLGITDVEFVYAEGLALGEESRNKGIAAARADVRRAAAQLRLAA